MKSLICFITLFFCAVFLQAQTYPISQNIANSPNTIALNNALKGKLIITAFVDTVAANSEGFLKNYDGALIKTTSPISAIWYRDLALYKWIQLLPGTLQYAWLVGGTSIFPVTSGNMIFGVTSVGGKYGIDFRTQNTTRFILDSTGILANTGTTLGLGYDPSNGNKLTTFTGGSVSNEWHLAGNSGTTAGTNFIGTTDDVDFVFKRQAIEAGRLSTTNTSFGVGTFGGTPNSQNTAIGGTALSLGTAGNNNTAVGYGANSSAIPTGTNTAIGSAALLNSSSNQNTGVGSSVLQSSTIGSANTGSGYKSLFSNTTGSYNTASGANSGNTNTTGSYNTYLGDSTGFGIITGSNNTIIGARVTGLSSSLANNIILADGAGNIRMQFNSSGNPKLTVVPSGVGTRSLRIDASGNVTSADTISYVTTSNLQAVTTAGNTTTKGIKFETALLIPTPTTGVSLSSQNDGLLTFNTPSANTSIFDFNSISGNQSYIWPNNSGAVALTSDLTGFLPLIGASYPTTAGDGLALISSTVTSGNLVSFSNSGSAAAGNTKNVLKISSVGANATSSQTVTGQTISVTNTGTTNTNVGLNITASGATNNYAIIVPSGGGKVGIGIATPDASSITDIASTTKGLLIPRMTTTQQNAISSPANGLTMYNTDSSDYVVYKSSAWRIIGQSGTSFALTNGSGTTANGTAVDLGGTATGNIDIDLATNTFRFSNGNVGIGTAPTVALDVTNDIRLASNGTYTDGLIKTDLATGTLLLGDVTGGDYVKIEGGAFNSRITFSSENTYHFLGNGILVENLAGTGTRAVLADASGALSAPISDARKKKNFKTVANYVDVLGMLRNPSIHGVFYNWVDSSRGKETEIGFTAQMFEKIQGLTGTMTKSGDKYLNYDRITSLLWEQNRLQQSTIDTQEGRIKALEAKVDKLCKRKKCK